MKKRGFLLIVTLLFMSSPVCAQANSPSVDADALIDRGLTLREHGHDPEALKLFKRAYDLSKTPRALAQVGLAEQALGLWVEADEHVGAALAAPSDPWIERNRAALAGALVTIKQHVGDLEVLGSPPGAEVSVNGKLVGTLPLAGAVRVVAGTATLEVKALGFIAISRPVIVKAIGLSRESVVLLPLPQPGGETRLPPAQDSPSGPAPAAPSSSVRQTLGWVAAGAAALFVAGGFAAYAVRESDVAIWNDPNRCLNVNPIQTRAENCGDHQSNFQTAEALIIAGFVGGGALALTSALLLTLRSGKEARHAGLACGPGPGTAGIACGGSF